MHKLYKSWERKKSQKNLQQIYDQLLRSASIANLTDDQPYAGDEEETETG